MTMCTSHVVFTTTALITQILCMMRQTMAIRRHQIAADISAILPPEIRNKSKPVIVTGLSPEGMPTTSFLAIPVIVHRLNIESRKLLMEKKNGISLVEMML